MSTLNKEQLNVIESVFEGIGLGIVATDKEGAITFSNQAAKAMLGLADETIALADWPAHYGIYSADGITL